MNFICNLGQKCSAISSTRYVEPLSKEENLTRAFVASAKISKRDGAHVSRENPASDSEQRFGLYSARRIDEPSARHTQFDRANETIHRRLPRLASTEARSQESSRPRPAAHEGPVSEPQVRNQLPRALVGESRLEPDQAASADHRIERAPLGESQRNRSGFSDVQILRDAGTRRLDRRAEGDRQLLSDHGPRELQRQTRLHVLPSGLSAGLRGHGAAVPGGGSGARRRYGGCRRRRLQDAAGQLASPPRHALQARRGGADPAPARGRPKSDRSPGLDSAARARQGQSMPMLPGHVLLPLEATLGRDNQAVAGSRSRARGARPARPHAPGGRGGPLRRRADARASRVQSQTGWPGRRQAVRRRRVHATRAEELSDGTERDRHGARAEASRLRDEHALEILDGQVPDQSARKGRGRRPARLSHSGTLRGRQNLPQRQDIQVLSEGAGLLLEAGGRGEHARGLRGGGAEIGGEKRERAVLEREPRGSARRTRETRERDRGGGEPDAGRPAASQSPRGSRAAQEAEEDQAPVDDARAEPRPSAGPAAETPRRRAGEEATGVVRRGAVHEQALRLEARARQVSPAAGEYERQGSVALLRRDKGGDAGGALSVRRVPGQRQTRRSRARGEQRGDGVRVKSLSRARLYYYM
ncbi:unnamed protein product [Trichogramma brassicae]|uniref:Uncharacterized protein n=1 Tax=Trichogramma brassicae TaxID=86971 RepID=A0A6H5J1N3_9HYME|nr:unnamed protein product [Trichogramma brassicae]